MGYSNIQLGIFIQMGVKEEGKIKLYVQEEG